MRSIFSADRWLREEENEKEKTLWGEREREAEDAVQRDESGKKNKKQKAQSTRINLKLKEPFS